MRLIIFFDNKIFIVLFSGKKKHLTKQKNGNNQKKTKNEH